MMNYTMDLSTCVIAEQACCCCNSLIKAFKSEQNPSVIIPSTLTLKSNFLGSWYLWNKYDPEVGPQTSQTSLPFFWTGGWVVFGNTLILYMLSPTLRYYSGFTLVYQVPRSASSPTLIIKKWYTSVWTFMVRNTSRWNQCIQWGLHKGYRGHGGADAA